MTGRRSRGTWPPATRLHTLTGHQYGVRAVAVTGDGTRAVTGSGDRTAIVWDLATGARLHTLTGHLNSVEAVAITGDGTRAVTASGDRTAIVWDLATGARLHTLTGHKGRVGAVAVTGDGARAVTASDDGTAIVWDLATGARLHTLTGHKNSVEALAVSRDGTRAVTVSDDRTMIVWDLATGARLHTLTGHKGRVGAVAVSSDGTAAVTGGGNAAIVWDLDAGRLTAAWHSDEGMSAVEWAPGEARLRRGRRPRRRSYPASACPQHEAPAAVGGLATRRLLVHRWLPVSAPGPAGWPAKTCASITSAACGIGPRASHRPGAGRFASTRSCPARKQDCAGDLQAFRGQAACVYSLIRPPRTGFRRICCVPASVNVARGAVGSLSGICWAVPWCGRAVL